MKNLFKTTVLMSAMLLVAFGSFAQNQYEAMKALGSGEYRKYQVTGKAGSYQFGYDAKVDPWVIKVENEDDIRRFQLQIKSGVNHKYTYSFGEDVIGYPVTMQKGGLKHPKLKYSKRVRPEERLVVVGDVIYHLTDYKSPTNYRLYQVFKKGKLSKMKAVKETYKAALTMKKEKLEEKLTDYLQKEFANQKSEQAKWKSANGDYYTQLNKEGGNWKDMIKDSDKQYAKLRNKHAIVKNKTGSTIYFTTGKGTPYKILSGKFLKVDCELAQMYRSNSAGDKLTPLFRPAKYCGKTFSVTK